MLFVEFSSQGANDCFLLGGIYEEAVSPKELAFSDLQSDILSKRIYNPPFLKKKGN